MMRKVRVEDSGDTRLLSGAMVDISELKAANAELAERRAAGEKRADGEELLDATYTQLLMGITKASLATDSFLSAASFQETTKVLTDAAIKGKVDHLVGLKEKRHHRQAHSRRFRADHVPQFQERDGRGGRGRSEDYVDLSVLVNRSNAL